MGGLRRVVDALTGFFGKLDPGLRVGPQVAGGLTQVLAERTELSVLRQVREDSTRRPHVDVEDSTNARWVDAPLSLRQVEHLLLELGRCG